MNEKKKILRALYFPIAFLVVVWVVWLSFRFLGADMAPIGIQPLTIHGLIGIVLSPFAHGSLSHIVANSSSFLVLSVALFYFYRLLAWRVFIISWLFSGALLWLGGRDAVHIGASGLVYSLAFFLFFSGIFRKNRTLGSISLIVVFLYGSMIWGMMPQSNGISWEGHIYGAIPGLILAWYYRKHPVDFIAESDGSSVSVTWGQSDDYTYNYLLEDDREMDVPNDPAD